MKWHPAHGLIVVAAIAAATPAPAKDKDKPGPSPLVTAIDRCRQVADAMQRLACYDSAANALVAAANAGTVAVVDQNEIRKARRSLFGFTPVLMWTLFNSGVTSLEMGFVAALVVAALAIAITGKPFILAAGADLSEFAKIVNRDQALAIARIGHAVYDKLRRSQARPYDANKVRNSRSAYSERSTGFQSYRSRSGPPQESPCLSASWAYSLAGVGPSSCPT